MVSELGSACRECEAHGAWWAPYCDRGGKSQAVTGGRAGVNYWERHIGDYARDAGHLSMLEHGAYTLLLDRYYSTEQPIPADHAHRICRARTRDERAAVDAVLSEFFQLVDGAWVNGRASREVVKAQTKIEAARTNGAKGGRPKGKAKATEQKPSGLGLGSISETQEKAHQTPDTRHQETPISPQGGKRPGAVSLKAWLESVKASGQKAIPEDDPVFAYAAEVSIPDDFMRLAWLEFRHRYSQPEAKRYKDWRSVFRKSVRGNWFKLWWLDPGTNQYGLTTVGLQAQRAHEERRAA